MKSVEYLVTGVAGFIGMATAERLLQQGKTVLGIDNLNEYYDSSLKQYRLDKLRAYSSFQFVKLDIADRDKMADLFRNTEIKVVIHLAAQAGVRYSIDSPYSYLDSNLVGMMTVLEGCRHADIEHLVFASSSSVYGSDATAPFSISERADKPVSLYAATKRSNELMAHSYSHLYQIPMTGLRFFTVYGPAGRPDMAPWLFTDAILAGRPIKVFNHGKMKRDFTYVDDIVGGILLAAEKVPRKSVPDKASSPDFVYDLPPFRVYNLGNNNAVELCVFIDAIEKACGKKAEQLQFPMQAGDVPLTCANIDETTAELGYQPVTDIYDGIAKFVTWFREYKNV
ncbi:NAD-dependent epimerase/dehydratase family protein [Pseudomaricurvus alkylphenolicus]|uniref:NAD-dependent epimerase/dehydratase family protein n=1 Tax=Pseudomaricurvus alkylphenolicus TaxID=1306991 RepID=UPI001420C025|nr:NAD-dependent epimerase/dehydratase family protein [Pseudomaricurvus alkylphenolicus]NIB43129.1 NAD-dependent epimerase/dehydratase family protein [Pseudomaricurvus alkylphenolicus]